MSGLFCVNIKSSVGLSLPEARIETNKKKRKCKTIKRKKLNQKEKKKENENSE